MDEKSFKKERKGRQESNHMLDNKLFPRSKTFLKEVFSSLSTYFVRNYAHIQATFRRIVQIMTSSFFSLHYVI
eukprot:scaffold16917_cov164-Skeletonema_dohrnii-CCMP3373.AAC.3